MPQRTNGFVQNNILDEDGKPAGGTATSLGIGINWQDGPINAENEPNGALIEDVISICINRLEFLQNALGNSEYIEAIQHLTNALHALNKEAEEKS